MNGFGELVPPYPRNVGRSCVSPFIPDVVFCPLSKCRVPNRLGNWQLEQGRIGVIGSSFGDNVSLFIVLVAAMPLAEFEYIFRPSSGFHVSKN